MPKINRFNGNVVAFSSEQPTNERYVFGSSSVVSDDLTAQFTPEALRGWGTVGPSEFPPLEWFNAVGFTATQFAAYLHQMGTPEWNSTQEYFEDSLATKNGSLYFSTSNSNIGNDPESGAPHWRHQGSKASLLSGSGYEILESGLIIQWFTASSDPTQSIDVPYPINFPTLAGAVVVSLSGGSSGSNQYFFTARGPTTSAVQINGFDAVTNTRIAASCKIIAIGF